MLKLKKIAVAVFCLALSAVGAYAFFTCEGAWGEKVEYALLMLFALIVMFLQLREGENGAKPLPPASFDSPAEIGAQLPHPLLAERFRELAGLDELVNADEPESFLGWSSEGDGRFHLFPAEEGGDDWFALWWGATIDVGCDAQGRTYVRAAKPMDYVADAEVESLCSRYGFPMQDYNRGLRANGLAFYREGQLKVYPAAALPAFRACFMESVLAPEPEFREWVEAYYAEDGEEDEENEGDGEGRA